MARSKAASLAAFELVWSSTGQRIRKVKNHKRELPAISHQRPTKEGSEHDWSKKGIKFSYHVPPVNDVDTSKKAAARPPRN